MSYDPNDAEKPITAAILHEAGRKAKIAIIEAGDMIEGHDQVNLRGAIDLYLTQLEPKGALSKQDVITYLIGRSDKAVAQYDGEGVRNEAIAVTQFAKALGIYEELEVARVEKRLSRGSGTGEPSATR